MGNPQELPKGVCLGQAGCLALLLPYSGAMVTCLRWRYLLVEFADSTGSRGLVGGSCLGQLCFVKRAEAWWSVRTVAAESRLPSLDSTHGVGRVLRHTGVVMPPGFRFRGVAAGSTQFLFCAGLTARYPMPTDTSQLAHNSRNSLVVVCKSCAVRCPDPTGRSPYSCAQTAHEGNISKVASGD